MDTKQFIAALVSSLAWPAAVVVVALLFRKQLAALLTRPLSRLRAGPVELEFARALPELEAEVAEVAAAPAPQQAEGEPTASAEPGRLVDVSPRAAVVAAHARLEIALRDLLGNEGKVLLGGGPGGAPQYAMAAHNFGLISRSEADAIVGLTTLRNRAVHDETELPEDLARRYVAVSDSLEDAIRKGKERRAVGG